MLTSADIGATLIQHNCLLIMFEFLSVSLFVQYAGTLVMCYTFRNVKIEEEDYELANREVNNVDLDKRNSFLNVS